MWKRTNTLTKSLKKLNKKDQRERIKRQASKTAWMDGCGEHSKVWGFWRMVGLVEEIWTSDNYLKLYKL